MRICVRVMIWGAFFGVCLPSHAETPAEHHDQTGSLTRFNYLQIRMAVPVRISVYASSEATANQAADAAYRRFKELDRVLSDYDPDSELSKLCRTSEADVANPVSDDLLTVLSMSQHWAERTGGAFDVTVGPLTGLWRKTHRRRSLPEAAELNACLQRVGWKKLEVSKANSTVSFKVTPMQLDVGGIAKGYAADEALKVMAEQGVTRVLIDAGGDVVAGDPPPGADGWRVGIAPLDDPRGQLDQLLTLRNAAVATSGDSARFVEIDGVRYSHIIDPRTGLGLKTHSSITVFAPTGAAADALASAVSVMGPEEGLKLINSLDATEAFVVTEMGETWQRDLSTGFNDLLMTSPGQN